GDGGGDVMRADVERVGEEGRPVADRAVEVRGPREAGRQVAVGRVGGGGGEGCTEIGGHQRPRSRRGDAHRRRRGGGRDGRGGRGAGGRGGGGGGGGDGVGALVVQRGGAVPAGAEVAVEVRRPVERGQGVVEVVERARDQRHRRSGGQDGAPGGRCDRDRG